MTARTFHVVLRSPTVLGWGLTLDEAIAQQVECRRHGDAAIIVCDSHGDTEDGYCRGCAVEDARAVVAALWCPSEPLGERQ